MDELVEEKVLYRYNRNYDKLNDAFWSGEDLVYEINLDTYKVLRVTESGFWINKGQAKDTFVLKSEGAYRRFAYESEHAALQNFIKRTRKCISYNKKSIKTAANFLKSAVELKKTNRW